MTKPSVVVVLAPALSARGGAERVAVTAASCLRAENRRVVLAYPGDEVNLDEVGKYFGVQTEGIESLRLPSQSQAVAGLEEVRIFLEQRMWHRRIELLQPDVFFNCMTGSELPPLAPMSLYYVHFPHAMVASDLPRARRVYMRLSRAARAVAFAGGRSFLDGYTVLANSEFTAHHVEARWGRTARVLYPPVADFGPGRDDRERWILGTGRFQDRLAGHPHKRQDAMIQAFAELTDLHREGWQLHLIGSVGSTTEVARLKRMAEGLPIVFHEDASVAELTDAYRRASIYWHAQGFEEPDTTRPDAQEHFGMTVAEAMSAGIVPLVYDTAGPREIVKDLPSEASGWRTVDELIMRTRRLAQADEATASELRRAVVAASRRFTGQSFSDRLAVLVEGGER